MWRGPIMASPVQPLAAGDPQSVQWVTEHCLSECN
jgi:hypothetical protein